MSGVPLSPELCHRIVKLTSTRHRNHLAVLCRTCKAFQREAEQKLYEAPYMSSDTDKLMQFCHTIHENPRYGAFVRAFYMYEQPEGRGNQSWNPPTTTFWHYVQAALRNMPNLEVIALICTKFNDCWIFDPGATPFPFQIRHLNLRLHKWEPPLTRFLLAQRHLEFFHYADMQGGTLERLGPPERLSATPWPHLQKFDGPLPLAVELITSYLCRPRTLAAYISSNDPTYVLKLVRRLSPAAPSLRALNLQTIAADSSVSVLALIAAHFPDLAHIGILGLPMVNRNKIHGPLIEMPNLTQLELDLSHWRPFPDQNAQRALVSELKVYRPTLRIVVFTASLPASLFTNNSGRADGVRIERSLWYCEGDMWTAHTRVQGNAANIDLLYGM